MRGKRLLAWTLSAIMAVSPLAACGQKPAGETAESVEPEEEMDRSLEPAMQVKNIVVDANSEGTYTVTITEDDLMEDQEYAEETPRIVTAEEAEVASEEEMTRNIVEVAEPENQDAEPENQDAEAESQDVEVEAQDVETESQDAEVEGQNAEAVDSEDDQATDEGQKGDQTDAEAPEVEADAESGEWSLGAVTQDDVVVSYISSVAYNEDGETAVEMRMGEVTDFENDGEAVTLTFQVEAVETDTRAYTVRFAGTDAYAVVQAMPVQEEVVVEDVDFDAQIAELANYKPDFKEEDLPLPEGTFIEDGELVVTEDADKVVQSTLVGSGYAAEDGETSEASGDEGDGEDTSVEPRNQLSNVTLVSRLARQALMSELRPMREDYSDDEDGAFMEDSGRISGGSSGSGYSGDASSGDWSVPDDWSVISGGGSKPMNPDSAAVKYMKEYNATQLKYRNFDAVADYAPMVLYEIHPTAGMVGEMGANAYRLFKVYAMGDWGSGIQGAIGIAKMFGLFKGKGATGVSNEMILSEIQKLGVEVADMHGLTKSMNVTLNETLRQAYANNLQSFDNAIIALHSNAEVVQAMLVEGAIRAAEDGIEPPAENCTADEEFEYNYDLIDYIKKLEQKGGRKNSAFIDFKQYVKDMSTSFVTVAGEVAKPRETNPVAVYDKYWDLHFNFDTQGYYLRQSYRTEIEYELKRAFGLMEIYYNMFDPYTRGNFMGYNTQLWDALDRLEELDAGASPLDVATFDRIVSTSYDYGRTLIDATEPLDHWAYKDDGRHYYQANGDEVYEEDVLPNDDFGTVVHCNSLNMNIKGINVLWQVTGNSIPTGLMEEFLRRLNGRTIQEDLELAGIWRDTTRDGKHFIYDADRAAELGGYANCAHGLGYNGSGGSGTYKVDLVRLDNGQILKGQKTSSTSSFSVFDSNAKQWVMPVMWFTLA